MNGRLGELLRHPGIWRATAGRPAAAVLQTGFGRLDDSLGGGWPRDTLIELLLPAPGIGELGLLLPALRGLCEVGVGDLRRWIAWIDPPQPPYAPALAGAGIDPAQMLVVRPKKGQVLWATEQALRSRACAAALAWVDAADGRELRRLKLAAEEGGSLGVLFRPSHRAREPSPAALRLLLEPQVGRLDVVVLKSPAGAPGRIEGLL